MSYSTVVFNGNNYSIPNAGEQGWTAYVNTYLSAVAAGAAGLNVANTFAQSQTFTLGVQLTQQATPTQAATNGQFYTGTDGNLYAVPSAPNSGVPIKLTGQPTPTAPTFAAKTGSYVIQSTEGQTRFSNTGATGLVQFTLPSPAAGFELYLTCAAAQTMTVVGGTFEGPGSLSGTTLTVYGALTGNRYTSFKLGCYDGATWVVQNLNGSIVVS